MGIMVWSPQLDVGVAAMNNDHQGLIKIMNQLHENVQAGAPTATLAKGIGELARLTVAHFGREEAFMESINYPKLAIHKDLHKKLLEKFAEHQAEFDTTGTLTPAFFNFLRFWLSAHIQGIDMQYGDAARGRAA
jgi:hemerythrin-like metal-binding protein